MTLQKFIARLNWRQILIHVIAFWFFICGFQTLSYLHDTKLIDTTRNSKGVASEIFVDNHFQGSDLADFLLWIDVSGFVGLLVAFLISLAISIRQRWFWVNALIAFIITYPLYKLNLLGWTYLRQFFWYFGQKFDNSTFEFLFNGIVLLAIGFLIFFLKLPNQFIENKKLATVSLLQPTWVAARLCAPEASGLATFNKKLR